MERIAVFHDKFATAHQSKSGANFVTKLRLNLIEMLGQLTIGTDCIPRDRRDYFLMGWSQTHLSIGAIGQGKHDPFRFGVSIPTSRFLP